MATNIMTRHRWMSKADPAVSRIARLSSFGLIGLLGLLSLDNWPRNPASLVGVLALAVLAGMTWYASRVRAEWRWRAALDRYAEQEEAKNTYSRRNLHARPQSQAR
jgi:Tfp pilus assembly protein PilO